MAVTVSGLVHRHVCVLEYRLGKPQKIRPPMNVVITAMQPEDWEMVRLIYEEGVATGHATFETDVPEWDVWDRNHMKACRLVARADGQVAGWAALSPVASRCVHSGVAEVSVYVRAAFRRQGVGKALMRALIAASERAGIWTLQGGVFPENAGSIALQKASGFREIGRQERLGRLQGVWRDVVLMERRSRNVGL